MKLEDLLANSLSKVKESDVVLSVSQGPLPDHEIFLRSRLQNAANDEIEKKELPDYLLNDPQVVGYPDLEMQENLYEYALRGVLPLVHGSVNPMAVVDIGAGRGDLKAYLERYHSGFPVEFEYFGYELNSIHKNIAKQKHGIELIVSDFANISYSFNGWGFCIGSLNDDYGLFQPDSPVSKFAYFGQLLDSCLRNISEGVVFILLNETPEDQENLMPFPIPEMVEFLDVHYPNLAFSLDASRFQGIYKLVIYNQYLQP